MNKKIFPVVLCGGIGKRLWPVSRQSHPKQFSKILEKRSLFQSTLERFNDPRFESPLIISSNEYKLLIEDQLHEIGVKDSRIIIEPCAKDTAPAILAAALILKMESSNPIMAILPSDHTVENQEALKSLICQGSYFSESGEIVTFGIKPDRIETGYGWIESSEKNHNNSKFHRVISFHEKPTKVKAENFFYNGNFLWNSGIYLVAADSIIESFKKHSPKLFVSVSVSVQNSKKEKGLIRLSNAPWEVIKPISIDYAIMEKVSNMLVAPYSFGWNDLGDWNAVWREGKKDRDGVYTSGPVYTTNCKNSYFRSENPKQQVIGLGCEDIIVVSMPDAVLVSNKSKSQEVKEAINQFNLSDQHDSWKLPEENRSWGKIEALHSEAHIHISRLVIHPRKDINFKRNILGIEHWLVLKGVAQMDFGKRRKILKVNQSINVPIGKNLHLRNTTDQPLIVIKVQFGPNIDSNDIEKISWS